MRSLHFAAANRGCKMANAGRAVVGLALVGTLLWIGTANATDQSITGKKLLITGTGLKVLVLSQDPSISIAGSNPILGADSSLTLDDGVAPPIIFSLPKSLWSRNGAGTVFKYRNSSAPSGPSAIEIAQLKSGLLKVVEAGANLNVPNGPATLNVTLSLDGGTNRYCLTFAGTGDGSKFVVRNAPAGTCPPTPTPTPTATPTFTSTPCPSSGQLVGGFCWYLGAEGASCDTTCAGVGLTCDPVATNSYAGAEGTDANCTAVVTALDHTVPFFSQVSFGDIGCFVLDYFGRNGARSIDDPTTCSAAFANGERACACQ
jgi:hypothetical protein